MSLNKYQAKVDVAYQRFSLAIASMEEATRMFYSTMADLNLAVRECIAETVCKWCHGRPCTCPVAPAGKEGNNG